MSTPQPVVCIYRVAPENDQKFQELLRQHAPTLDAVGLKSSEPSRCFKGKNQMGEIAYVEMFSWKDPEAADVAHQTPEIMQIWEPMGDLTTSMEFIDIAPLE